MTTNFLANPAPRIRRQFSASGLPALLLSVTLVGCTAPNPSYLPLAPPDGAMRPADLSGQIVDLAVRDAAVPPVADLSMSDLAASIDLAAPAQITFIPMGARWRYLDNGSDQGAAWRAPAYDDNAWRTGPAELGYGDGDEATVVGFGPNANQKYVTTYFRVAFDTPLASRVTKLALRVVRDDGVAVYLNGVEAARDNMPMGNLGYTTLAANAISGADESAWQPLAVDPKLLVDGRNVVAVEIHQNAVNSSDISFNLELVGTTN